MYAIGTYVYNAVSISLSNAFRKKGDKAIPWMEEPIRLIPLTEEEQSAKAEEEKARAIAFFNAMMPGGGED